MILVGSRLRLFSIDIKSCHRGRSRVSSQALESKHIDRQTNTGAQAEQDNKELYSEKGKALGGKTTIESHFNESNYMYLN